MDGGCVISVRFLREGGAVALPAYQTEGSSGVDLHADIDEEVVLPPMGRALVPTGIAVSLPPGVEAQVRP
ncbi:MAG: dut, partial [Actinobacteria bacterium]|nr:dut [Actinomycetota bacterium]